MPESLSGWQTLCHRLVLYHWVVRAKNGRDLAELAKSGRDVAAPQDVCHELLCFRVLAAMGEVLTEWVAGGLPPPLLGGLQWNWNPKS